MIWGRIRQIWQKLVRSLEDEETKKMRQVRYVLRYLENPDEDPEWVFEMWGQSGFGPLMVERLKVRDRDKIRWALVEVYRRVRVPWEKIWVVDPVTGELKPVSEYGIKWKEYRLRK